MIKISKQEVERIVKLARIDLKKPEVERFKKELSNILNYFNLLKKIDVSGVEPTFHPAECFFGKGAEIMRKDEAKSQPKETVNKLVEAAPEKKGRHIKVKAIL